MYTSGLRVSLAATFLVNFLALVAARPTSDTFPREAAANNDLACRQAVAEVTSFVYVTIETTTTDFYSTTTIEVTAEAAPSVIQGVAVEDNGLPANEQPIPTPPVPTISISPVPTTSTSPVPTTSTSLVPIQPVASFSHSPIVPPVSATSAAASLTESFSCTTGDADGDLGFYITNSGTVDATYYFYAAAVPYAASEQVPYKCIDVKASQTKFSTIEPWLRGRIMRGLPYSATPDHHPALGPASWVEFFHNATAKQLWGDISLIQGYDGAITIEGQDGTLGFSDTLDMKIASASFPAALTTKTGYPSNIPAPTVIGPTVQTSVSSNQQAYAFYANGYPNGPCGSIQNTTYVSNDPKFNPNFQTGSGRDYQVFNVTFYEGIV